MSTTKAQILDQVTSLREENARILEEVRSRGENAPPVVGEMANLIGRFLDSVDESLLRMGDALTGDEPDHAVPLGELTARCAGAVDLDIDGSGAIRSASIGPFPLIPSPDALFRARGIVIQYHHQDKGWYAMRERRQLPGVDDGPFLPALVLYDDGWDEWGKGRKGRMFEHEIEARTMAAATAFPGEPIPGAPDRIAFIIVADAPHEPGGGGEGVSITAHFDQRPDMPVDLVNPQGAHRVAMDALRFIGGATNTTEQIERGLVAASDGGGR
jgi:hypothetical protein